MQDREREDMAGGQGFRQLSDSVQDLNRQEWKSEGESPSRNCTMSDVGAKWIYCVEGEPRCSFLVVVDGSQVCVLFVKAKQLGSGAGVIVDEQGGRG